MAVFLTEKEKKKYKIYKKGSLPESNNILSHQAEACRRQETPPCLLGSTKSSFKSITSPPFKTLGCYLAGYGIIFCNDSNVFPGNAGSDGCTKGIG